MKLEKFIKKFIFPCERIDICEDDDTSATVISGEPNEIMMSEEWEKVKDRKVSSIMTVIYDEDYDYDQLEKELNDDLIVLVIYVK